jgi:hypothetical protein
MILKERDFNHNKDAFHEAMNIPSYMRTKCRERIFFASFSNALQREELFEDENDAPKDMSTVTGDLQRCLRMINDPLEYEYTLLTFYGHQRMAMEVYAKFKFLNSNSQSKEDKIKMSIINLIHELKSKDDEDDDKEEDEIDNINVTNAIKRVHYVKKSSYNFDTYLSMLTKNLSNHPNNDFNVDDFLKDIFN